jgi:hemerythrin-like domain-containing protein
MRKTSHLSKKQNKRQDILHLIAADHESLRESIEILLMEESSITDKKRQLERFLRNLEIHTKTEQQSFYDSVISFKQIRPLILEAYEEHTLADNLCGELKNMSYLSEWTDAVEAKTKVLAELVKRHLEEEEAMLFPLVRNNLTKAELDNLGMVYLQKRIDTKHELDQAFTLPSLPFVDDFSNLVQGGWRGAFNRVSSYVSKFNPSR